MKDKVHQTTIRVPELEALIGTFPDHSWTDRDTQVLRRYYGRVPTAALAKQLGRTRKAIWEKANNLGLGIRDRRNAEASDVKG